MIQLNQSHLLQLLRFVPLPPLRLLLTHVQFVPDMLQSAVPLTVEPGRFFRLDCFGSFRGCHIYLHNKRSTWGRSPMRSDLPVQIIANRAGIVLLNNLEHNGAVGLGGLLHILLDLLDCPIMCNILLQHEVKSLTDTGCFYSLHNTASALKINM